MVVCLSDDRSDTELVESTIDATPDDVDIDSVTLNTRSRQTTRRSRPWSSAVSQRCVAPVPPRRHGAQRHIATRLLHHCLPATLNNCTSFSFSTAALLSDIHYFIAPCCGCCFFAVLKISETARLGLGAGVGWIA